MSRVVHPSETRTEQTWIVMPGQCNSLNTVFGGQIMAWVDVAAAVAAQRFCRSSVVTAAMDQLLFRGPIQMGQIVVLQATVNWAGNTSMEVGVRVESEDPKAGTRTHSSTAYLTFVALDEQRNPISVPTLEPVTEDEIRRHDDASRRRELRLHIRAQDKARRRQ
ncbi:MAG: acyl-CoA thioesterase [Rhodobacterales bacterium]|nr:acyl-CoA thioesterase [Rhodobacterales bacterium]